MPRTRAPNPPNGQRSTPTSGGQGHGGRNEQPQQSKDHNTPQYRLVMPKDVEAELQKDINELRKKKASIEHEYKIKQERDAATEGDRFKEFVARRHYDENARAAQEAQKAQQLPHGRSSGR
jgi:hypothetical protein